jgi:hypothetical protein
VILWALLDLTAPVKTAIQVIVAIGGFFTGYFLGGPFVRFFWWLLFRRSVPPSLYPWLKLLFGVLLAALLYFFLQLGGGGGWGFGGPGGGGSGTGKGTGTGVGPGTNGPPDKKDNVSVEKKGVIASTQRNVLEIELLGGRRFQGDGKYYLLGRKEPAVDLAKVEEVLRKNPDKWDVYLVFTNTSVGTQHPAAIQLRNLAQRYEIPHVDKLEDGK